VLIVKFLCAVYFWLQEGIKILNRFGYKNQTDQFLVMAENFRPENCFVIQVCVCIEEFSFVRFNALSDGLAEQQITRLDQSPDKNRS